MDEEFKVRCKSFGNIPSRMILYLLSLTCMVVSFMMRSIMSLTILAMVKEHDLNLNETQVEEKLCYNDDNTSITLTPIHYGGTLEWSLNVQYYVLTAFYWTYIPFQVIGGIAAQRFGTKIVVGYALLITSLCNIFVPLASGWHYVLVVILQMLQGVGLGLTWPAFYAVISSWIPLQEKSRFVTCFQGMSIGSMIAQLMSGFIIASIGWVYVFYTIGSLGLLWCLVWYLLAFDKPELHPRISVKELAYIQENRESALHSEKRKVPWMSMVLSLPMWAIGVTSFGRLWLYAVASTYGPLYLKTIIGLPIEMIGVWSSVYSLGTFLLCIVFSYISDKLFIHEVLSLVTIRKLMTGIGQIIPGLLCISIGYLHCDTTLILSVWILAQTLTAGSFSGSMVNIVDITPNFTGPVTSIIQTILMLPSIFATLVSKSFLESGSTLESWRGIFNVSGGVIIATYLFYLAFASATVQKWDYGKNSINNGDVELREEVQALNVKDNIEIVKS